MTDYPSGGPSDEPFPSSHIALAVVSCVLCQLCGVVALVYGAQVSSEWRLGNRARAREYSRLALGWSIAGILMTLVGGGLIFLFALNA
jgi:cation transporter-like permease